MKTLTVAVRPIYGARMGLSVLYLYRGKRLHGTAEPVQWGQRSRDDALLFARRRGFTRVRFDIADDYYREPRVSVAELAAVRFPDSELIAQIPRVAWMGGEAPPRKSRDLSRRARALVREAFRESMRASVDYWGDGAALCYRGDRKSTLGNARIQWRRAIADAFASVESAHRARLYQTPGAQP